MKRWIVLAWLFVCLPVPCGAGECPESESNYILWIRGGCTSCDDPEHSLGCITCYPGDWANWAGPGTAAVFRSCRQNKRKPDLIESARVALARPAMTDSAREFRRQLTRTLASWGVDHVDSFAVYDSLVAGIEVDPLAGQEDWMALAVLGDPRTADFVASIYDSLRIHNYSLSAPRAALNCLYHIPGSRPVEVARGILSRETDPSLRERAERVITRPSPGK